MLSAVGPLVLCSSVMICMSCVVTEAPVVTSGQYTTSTLQLLCGARICPVQLSISVEGGVQLLTAPTCAFMTKSQVENADPTVPHGVNGFGWLGSFPPVANPMMVTGTTP